MNKYRVSVMTLVEVYIDVEAEDEFEAGDKVENRKFSLEESVAVGGHALSPVDDEMSAVCGEPDYDNREINVLEEFK